MKINILHGWQGTGHKVFLPAGEHDVTKALGEYLVKNGHAVAIDAPAPNAQIETKEFEALDELTIEQTEEEKPRRNRRK